MRYLLPLIVVLGVIAAGLYYWNTRVPEDPQLTGSPPMPADSVDPGADPFGAPDPPPPIVHPAPAPVPADPPVPLPPLPPLGPESDPVLHGEVAALVGEASALRLGLADEFARRLVVTLDNLANDRVAVRDRPIAPVEGSFAVGGDEDHPVLVAENFARYDRVVRLAAALPVDRLVQVYARYYPLLQEAYDELGYPGLYFNDRLVAVIDHLLEAPEVNAPIALSRPHVLYEYADPALEARSAGQKLLIRMGPENARIVKEKLRELRPKLAL